MSADFTVLSPSEIIVSDELVFMILSEHPQLMVELRKSYQTTDWFIVVAEALEAISGASYSSRMKDHPGTRLYFDSLEKAALFRLEWE